MKHLCSLLLRYGISLLCLLYAFRGVPLTDLWAILYRFPAGPMVMTVLVSFLAYAAMAVRLTRMRRPGLPFRTAFCASLAGLALNNVLPAKAGEVAKAAWIGRECGLSWDESLGIVFMERFFDVNVLALLSLWFLWELGQKGAALTLVLCLAAGWSVLFLFRRQPGWARFWEHLPLPARAAGFLVRFTLALVDQASLPGLTWMTFSSLSLWALYALQIGVALNGAAGLGLEWSEALGVFALSSLGMLLPSSPGALGVYEAVAVAALIAYGTPRDQALAAALFMHMAQFIPVTLAGGLVLLLFPGRARKADPDEPCRPVETARRKEL